VVVANPEDTGEAMAMLSCAPSSASFFASAAASCARSACTSGSTTPNTALAARSSASARSSAAAAKAARSSASAPYDSGECPPPLYAAARVGERTAGWYAATTAATVPEAGMRMAGVVVAVAVAVAVLVLVVLFILVLVVLAVALALAAGAAALGAGVAAVPSGVITSFFPLRLRMANGTVTVVVCSVMPPPFCSCR
jgi:hypothetical protein